LRANKSVENFFELWRRQLKNFQDKGRTKARGFIVLRQMCSIPVRLAKRDSVELDFERQIKPYTATKILADLLIAYKFLICLRLYLFSQNLLAIY
ncbi:MAG: hypothetical protein II984_02275, partial [Clostridia bacterium]|nr:hypothetical protein [Clostridia bacterium]